MQYPTMKGGAQYRVEIPQLCGGVNLSDLPTQVEDNQLTDVHNMWWHQGVLRTRPGLTVKQQGILEVGALGQVARFVRSHSISEQELLLSATRTSPDGKTGSFYGYILDPRNGITNLGSRHDVTLDPNGYWSNFSVRADKNAGTDYYFFLSDGKVLKQGEDTEGGNGKTLVDAEPYVPHVTVERRNEDGSVNNVKFEGYNMLTPQFKCSFSTDGKRMSFYLPAENLDYYDVTVEVTVAHGHDMRKLTFTIPAPESDVVPIGYGNSIDDVVDVMFSHDGECTISNLCATAELNYDTGQLSVYGLATGTYEDGTTNSTYILKFKEVTSNNIVVTASKTQKGQRETICRMTQATWFGGARSGLDSGARLFVAGNPEKSNLVHWSDINNPLYFPENNHFYVGGADQSVTGFGKQGELLVIFKERELYCSQYVAGNAITADDLISGAVTDIAAMTAQFPLTPLHPTIGCDCPGTIRLVNNRLVWATSDAHVYMLTSVNQYSERNVRDITALIRRDLEKHTADELKAATATEYKGHYMLMLPDGTAYLLDVGNSAFQSYAYYASESKANRALPWTIWKLDVGGDEWVTIVGDNERLCLLKQPPWAPMYGGQEWTLYDLDGDTDVGEPIPCRFTTKLFDFGRSDRLKAVREMTVRVGAVPESCVHLSYLVDDSTLEDVYRIEPTEGGELYDAGYIRSYRITPNVNRARLFGMRFDSDGAMAVEGIGLNYSMQGVIR